MQNNIANKMCRKIEWNEHGDNQPSRGCRNVCNASKRLRISDSLSNRFVYTPVISGGL